MSPSLLSIPAIRPIEESSRQRIVAGQAIFDLASAAKELVDNSLDAGAKSINIRLWNAGAEMLEVSDDGAGVPPASRPFLAAPHATSKITRFEDIYDPLSQNNTLGFRGEALFCLSNLSANLVVSTRTANEPVGQKMEFQRNGALKPDSVSSLPRKVGTTVCVVRLLDAVPVRRADLVRRSAEQRRKLQRILEGYAIFSPGVKIQLIDILKNRNERMLLTTTANSKNFRDTISQIMGSKQLSSMAELEVDVTNVINQSTENNNEPASSNDETATRAQDKKHDSPPRWFVKGYISKIPSGTAERLRDDQSFAINGRPVDLPKFSRMLNEVWRTLGASVRSRPCCVLEFILPKGAFDINVSPDKREVILSQASELLDKLQERVTEFWSSQIDGKFEAAPDFQNPSSKRPAASLDATDATDQNATNDEPVIGSRPAGTKFNRRYAFSHDVKRIRLQHQYDDGRVKASYEKFTTPAYRGDSSSDEDQDVNEDVDEEQSGNVETESCVEELGNGASMETTVDPTLPGNEDQSETESEASSSQEEGQQPTSTSLSSNPDRNASEDKLWRLTRQRFQRNDSSETRQEERRAFDRFLAPSSSASNARSARGPAASASHRLEQFGFQVKKKAAESSNSSNVEQSSNLPLMDRPSKRVSFDSGPHPASPTAQSPASAQSPSSLTAQSPSTEDEVPDVVPVAAVLAEENKVEQSSDNPFQTSGKPDESSDQVTLDDADHGSKSSARETSSGLTWASFSDTNSVIAAARRERVAVRERRQRSKLARDSPSAACPSNGDDDDGKISLKKGDFEKMQILGQFNLGFILAKTPENHVFIIDQHASDEKYNFEKLVAETVMHEQPLIAPMPLELSLADESCVLDNMEIFEKNGFRFRYDDKKPPRNRLSLIAIPHSGARDGRKAVQFGKEDVPALCAILGADDTGTAHDLSAGSGTGTDGSGMYGNNAVRRYVKRSDDADRVIARLPKAIAMFASRACRSSIMIGKSLSIKEMDRVVKRMGRIDHPWNCPHGRPTMRHLADLRTLVAEDDRKMSSYIAGPTAMVMTQTQEVEAAEEDEDEEEEY